MSEKIFNVFMVFESGRCNSIVYKTHDFAGPDDEGLAFLKARIDEDFKYGVRFDLPRTFSRDQYHAHCRLGRHRELYDEMFQAEGAGPSPLSVVSEVVDGVLKVGVSVHHDDPNFYLTPQTLGSGTMSDWLIKYSSEAGIDIPLLIHDDYFSAIKLTYNAGLYVSSGKLLVSCIDSVAYIEFGDRKDFQPFVRWLATYADLSEVGVTPEELWELRNSLLHMTNLNSRQVAAQKVRRVSIRVGGQGGLTEDDIYYFEFMALIRAFSAALERWIASYNKDRSKFVVFVERYDQTISDSRFLNRPVEKGCLATD